MIATILSLAPLLTITTAHFLLDYPIVRGFDESILGTFPCGGQSKISPNRTTVSSTSIPIALTMGHDQTVIQVLLGLGNDVGDNFNIVLEPTFAQVGLGKFCLPHVPIPSSLNITDGMNATVQVVTDGDSGGGLYNVRLPSHISCTISYANSQAVRRHHIHHSIRECAQHLQQWHRRVGIATSLR